MVTLKVRTTAGSNASQIGARYTYEGVNWRNATDSCGSNDYGRVFLDCEDAETAEHIISQMEDDNDVIDVEEVEEQ